MITFRCVCVASCDTDTIHNTWHCYCIPLRHVMCHLSHEPLYLIVAGTLFMLLYWKQQENIQSTKAMQQSVHLVVAVICSKLLLAIPCLTNLRSFGRDGHTCGAAMRQSVMFLFNVRA